MLDLTPQNLRNEIESAKRLRNKRLSQWSRKVAEYCGPAYDGSGGDSRQENTAFEVVASINPQLVFANPRIRLKSTRPEFQSKRVQALELAVNRWIKDTDPRQLYEEIAVDFQFGYGVILTKPAVHHVRTPRRTTEDFDDPLYRPMSERVSPNEFVCDPVAKSFRQARWLGHPITMDLDDLLHMAEEADADEGWHVDAIREMADGEGSEELESDDPTVDRKSVTFYELWIPEHELDESPGHEKGFHGSWHTVCLSDANIRDPRPAFCPRWGPYSFFGAYVVPSEQHALSLLTVADGVDGALNRQADANLMAMERRKSLIFAQKGDLELAENVEAAFDGGVVVVATDDIKNQLVQFELAGATETGLAGQAVTRDQRDRTIGLADAQRGEVTGAGTATENVLAQQASSIRVSQLQQKFRLDGVRSHLKTVAWYLDMDSRVVIYLGTDAKEKMGVEDPVYVGGLYPESEQRTRAEFPKADYRADDEEKQRRVDDFDLLELDIETYSMDRPDDPVLQARAIQGFQIALQVGQAAPQMPWIDFDMILEQIGSAMNWPGFSQILNKPMAAEVANMLLQQQVAQPQPNTKGRLASDLVETPGQGNPFGLSTGKTQQKTAVSV